MDNSTQDWVVTVVNAANPDATLSALSYNIGETGSVSLTAAQLTEAATSAGTTISLSNNVTDAAVTFAGTATAASEGATITSNNGVTLSNGAGTATIVVTAADGTTTKTYTVKFAKSAHDYYYLGTFSSSPVKWRVLSTEGNGGTYKDSAGNEVDSSEAIFMTTENLLGTSMKSGLTYSGNYVWNSGNNYYTWLSGTFASSLSSSETSAILKTTKASANVGESGVGMGNEGSWNDALADATLFMPSLAEVGDSGNNNTSLHSSTYFSNSADRIGYTTSGEAYQWVTRSRAYQSQYFGYASTIIEDGTASPKTGNQSDSYVRPAMNLNASAVIITTDAVNGKPSSVLASGTAMSPIVSNSSEHKVTLMDSTNQKLTVTGYSTANGVTTFSYTGATTGADEYVSAIVTDENGTVKDYAKVASAATESAGTVSITLPADFDSTSETLSVISEKCNSDYYTDYASSSTGICGVGVKSMDKAITSYSIPSQISSSIDATAHTVTVNMPAGTTVTALVPTFSLSTGASAKVGSAVQVSGTSSNNFTNPVTYTVTAEDGSTQDWVVTVNFVSNDATLSALSYTVGTGTPVALTSGQLTAAGTSNTTIVLPNTTSATAAVVLTPTTTNASATAVTEGITLSGGSGTATVAVTAADGTTTKTYTVKFATTAYETIYYGTNNGTPVKWYQLSTVANDATQAADCKTPALFLMSANTIGTSKFYGSSVTNPPWSGSTLQTYCQGLYSSLFTSAEQSGILKVTKTESGTVAYQYNAASLSNDTLFAPSAFELTQSAYKFNDNLYSANANRMAYDENGTATSYWGRSALGGFMTTDSAQEVSDTGAANSSQAVTSEMAVRPLMNIDSSKVLMKTAAAGAKTNTVLAEGTAIPALAANTTGESKLTMLDSSLSMTATKTASTDTTVSVDVSVASGDYVAAIVTDKDGNIQNYSKVYSTDGGFSPMGSVTITLPAGFDPSTQSLKLYAESASTDYKTDYASTPVTVYGFVPTYSVQIGNSDPAEGFATLTYGYTTGSSVTYTIENKGNMPLTGIKTASSLGTNDSFTLTWADGFDGTLAVGGSTTVTVASKTGLGAGTYGGTLTIKSAEDSTGSTATLSQVVAKADQSAPTTIGVDNETVAGANDGVITGVTDAMEYRPDGTDTYTAVASGKTEVTGLAAGTYHVRYAANDNKNASPDTTIVIAPGVAKDYDISVTDAVPNTGFADLVYGYTTGSSVVFKVTNSGNEPLTGIISNTSLGTNDSFTYTWADGFDGTLASGASTTVKVTSKTGLAVGTYGGTLTIKSAEDTTGEAVKLSQVVTKASQLAPALGIVNETVDGAHDGIIKGVTDKMEYKLSTATDYTAVATGATEITGLAPGTYDVRYAETDTQLAGADAQVIVATGAARTYVIAVTAQDPSTGFASLTYGYAAGSSVTYTITNNGNSEVTGLTAAIADGTDYFECGDLSATSVKPGESITVTITSKTGLMPSSNPYTANLIVQNAAGDAHASTGDIELSQGVIAASQDAPTTVAAVAESVSGAKDGALTGLTDAMEYKLSTSDTYTAVPAGATSVTGLAAGTYQVRYAAKEGYLASPDATVTIAAGQRKVTWTRLAGSNRYDTMKAIVDAGFTSSSTVLVASGANFPDALAATALAGTYNAPIVLTDPSSLSEQASAEITRLGASKIIIVGGTAAVSSDVQSALGSISGVTSVTRISGSGRAATALQIYKSGTGWSKTAIITTGNGYADALSISPYAYATTSPIFLASNGSLDSDTLATLTKSNFDKVIIVGGSSAVSSDTQSTLETTFGAGNVTRLAGGNRYETSTAIAKFANEAGVLSYDNMAVATGTNFPDALAGAAFCGSKKSVLLLSDYTTDGMQAASSVIGHATSQINSGYYFGGSGVVTEQLANFIEGMF